MNKILAVLLFTVAMAACTSRSDKAGRKEAIPPTEKQEEQADDAGGLVLNNGAKWKADSTTWLNVELLHSIVAEAKKEQLSNYVEIATHLQSGLNKMVAECKMKGADHEALHHWLEPLLEKTKELGKSNSVEEATALFADIENQINLFTQYFELS